MSRVLHSQPQVVVAALLVRVYNRQPATDKHPTGPAHTLETHAATNLLQQQEKTGQLPVMGNHVLCFVVNTHHLPSQDPFHSRSDGMA